MASIHEGFVQIHPELKLALNNFINPNKNLHTDHHLQQWHISLSISFWQHGDTRTSWTTLTYFILSWYGKAKLIGQYFPFLFFKLDFWWTDESFLSLYSRLPSVQTFHQLLDFDRLLRAADGLAYVLFLSFFSLHLGEDLSAVAENNYISIQSQRSLWNTPEILSTDFPRSFRSLYFILFNKKVAGGVMSSLMLLLHLHCIFLHELVSFRQ